MNKIKQNNKNTNIIIANIFVFSLLSFFLVISLYATHSPIIMLKININISIKNIPAPIIPVYVKYATIMKKIATNIPMVFASK